jgi:hypothetical protein
MNTQECTLINHHPPLFRADVLPLEIEGASLAAAPTSGCAALLFGKTLDLKSSPEAGDRSGRTWVWNGRTWVWNGAGLAGCRTWVWNGKAADLSSFHQGVCGKIFTPRNGEGRLL